MTITFKVGTDVNQAQVLVQTVWLSPSRGSPNSPQIGVTTKKELPDFLWVVTCSPRTPLDQAYISNYALIR